MPQPRAEKTAIVHESVEVAAIDKTARKITVKMPNGEKAQIQVPTEVQEFDKLKVGDKIDIDYVQSVALGFLPQGTKPSVTERAAAGPGMAGRQMSVSAEVIKVDPANNQVTFKGPKGTHRTVTVQDPESAGAAPEPQAGAGHRAAVHGGGGHRHPADREVEPAATEQVVRRGAPRPGVSRVFSFRRRVLQPVANHCKPLAEGGPSS